MGFPVGAGGGVSIGYSPISHNYSTHSERHTCRTDFANPMGFFHVLAVKMDSVADTALNHHLLTHPPNHSLHVLECVKAKNSTLLW